MSSIAYVSDYHMLEYHRINGNEEINFWKPSNQKKISDFHIGDFLFFLAKGSERGNEKGIVGYGILSKLYTMNIDKMWSKFKTLNGYPTKELLMEAIIRINKNHEIPNSLHCMYLKEVTFFQSPVYLSELGIKISNNIESYMYLDKEDPYLPSKILEYANHLGVDMWSSLFRNEPVNFEKKIYYQFIKTMMKEYRINIYNKYEMKKTMQFIQKVMKVKENCLYISNNKLEFIQENNGIIILYIPCKILKGTFEKNIRYLLGQYQYYHYSIIKNKYETRIQISFIFDQDIPKDLEWILNQNSIPYEIIKLDESIEVKEP